MRSKTHRKGCVYCKCLRYALGLRSLGLEVFWIDGIGGAGQAGTRAAELVEQFQPWFEKFGLGDHWTVLVTDPSDPTKTTRSFGMKRRALEAACSDAVLLIN